MAFYRKTIPSSAPRDYAAWEAAGLRWLAQATPAGGVRVVEVLEVGERHLNLERFAPCQPTPAQAEDFGRALAATHGAGAGAYGMSPQGWTGPGFLGPADDPLPLPLDPTPSWGIFFGEHRIRHTVRLGRTRGLWDGSAGGVFEAVADRLGDGEFDDNQPPARLHGDLWSGNVLWTQAGAVLIDPAAHGGHRETDLAMLALFGAPHLERIIAAYAEASPLADGWRERVALHQLHPVMLHAVLFGGGYVDHAAAIARQYA
ncbi:fructosamine kinase family protein [Nostocoides veronense]|uniref:Fructosamine kinase family protein n=1 Tax=Nostocoides veronense TaxID=330836 RepID=A0ABN2M4W2_9MICO